MGNWLETARKSQAVFYRSNHIAASQINEVIMMAAATSSHFAICGTI